MEQNSSQQVQKPQNVSEMLSGRQPGVVSVEEALRAYALGANDKALLSLIDSLFSSEQQMQQQSQEAVDANSGERVTGVTLYKGWPPKKYDEPTT